ncbi:MAG: hypothetical protein MJ145_05240 [Clostridia bacterium]|nr:hypothetical protein [Clostridia bacterium]
MKKKSNKKAYWTQQTHLLKADEYICSACGYSAKKALKECPGCGAIMSKSKYDPTWVDEAEILDMIFDD